MYKSTVIFFTVFILSFCIPVSFSQTRSSSLSYDYLLELGKNALGAGDFSQAQHYFTLANFLYPWKEEPVVYLNLTKRIKEGRVKALAPFPETLSQNPASPSPGISREQSKARHGVVSESLDLFEKRSTQKLSEYSEQQKEEYTREIARIDTEKEAEYTPTVPLHSGSRRRRLKKMLDYYESILTGLPETKKETPVEKTVALPAKKRTGFTPAKPKKKAVIRQKSVTLTDDMFAATPVSLMMEIGTRLEVKGEAISRFIAVSPEFLDIERKDDDTITIIPKGAKGSSFVHLWDARGRWVIDVEIVFPVSFTQKEQGKTLQESAEPFEFVYSADWASYYRGKRPGTMKKESLTFVQWAGIYGDTPYGKFDTSAQFTKFDLSTEVTSYTIGLMDGKIGPFENFDIRGFDIYKYYSDYSVPGEGMRGVTLTARAFNDMLSYDLFWGRENIVYGVFTSGSIGEKESFLEGGRLTLFPHTPHEYSLNFAHGYGSAREAGLKDRVWSLETKNTLKNAVVTSETAYDGDQVASIVTSSWAGKDKRLTMSFRNIEKGFSTISGRPGDRGELGWMLDYERKVHEARFTGYLDIWKDREFPNQSNPDGLIYDIVSTFNKPLKGASAWNSAVYYTYAPGFISPYRTFRLVNTYSDSFKALNARDISVFLSHAYQRNRYSLSSSSSFDRNSLSAGVRFPLINNVSYYLNYDYSWLTETSSGGKSHPRVLTTGLNCYRQLSPSWTADANLSYRNEEDALATNSFLGGEDLLSSTLGFTYRPSEDFEFFINSSFRNHWTERPGVEAYNSADVRFGVRSSWDLPFTWSPRATIYGVVFRDLNGNRLQDNGEPGISDIGVLIGKNRVTTDADGHYKISVRAKVVVVSLDIDTMPSGHVFSTDSSKRIEIRRNADFTVDFGLTTQSGIYGAVFYDANGNGKPDPGDTFINDALILLDGKDKVRSDTQGAYFFRGIDPGRHILQIDINSLPLEYIPLVKLKNTIALNEGTTYILNIPLKRK